MFERYLGRLIGLTRAWLAERLARKVDVDDIVQSAFRSFFVRARKGQYVVERAGDLWSLLATITKYKLLKKAEHYRQQKRNLDRDQPLAAFESADDGLFAEEPTEIEAVALADEVEFLMRDLDPMHREMLERRLQGQTIPAIAEAVERSERTVRRFLGGFRQRLEERLNSLHAE